MVSTQFIDSYSNAKSFIQKTVQKLPSSRTEKNHTTSIEFETAPTPIDYKTNPLSLPTNDDRPVVQIQHMLLYKV